MNVCPIRIDLENEDVIDFFDLEGYLYTGKYKNPDGIDLWNTTADITKGK